MGLQALANHRHRGAVAADGKTGDGAGVMTCLPHELLARVWSEISSQRTPEPGRLAVGAVFLPLGRPGALTFCRRTLEETLRAEGLVTLGWRDVPVNLEALGQRALSCRPHIQQIFVDRGEVAGGKVYEDALYRARRRAEALVRATGDREFSIVSLSHKTIVYKGLCLANQLSTFYPDLKDEAYHTPVCLFHQRYSTNTFPAWKLAQPFRMICHNGEFNTLTGNRTWMRARENALQGDELADYTPIIGDDVSDSGAFDNVLEFFQRRGRALLPCLLMMIPEIWERVDPSDMPAGWRDLYHHYSCLMEPWDGPAAVSFFDGHQVGTLLDRNGLRPSRYTVTEDGLVVCASECGVVDLSGHRVKQAGQLGPGEILVVDIESHRVLTNHQLKDEISKKLPYADFNKNRIRRVPEELFYGEPKTRESLLAAPAQKQDLRRRQLVFGYSHEEQVSVVRPMAASANEPIGSMGDDTPPAALSRMDRPFFHYFRQRFAQVTNPPIDPLRESLVMSLRTQLGHRANILVEEPERTNALEIPGPILSRAAFEYLHTMDPRLYPAIALRSVYAVAGGAESLAQTLEDLCLEAEEAVRQGASLIVLYDGEVNAFRAPIPSLLAVSAVHQHLIDKGLRLRASLVVASGEPREVHHFACLLGYGADAIYPFLALESIGDDVESGGRHWQGVTAPMAHQNFIRAIEKGLHKIMAKMGISLLASYRGAQVFEALGLSQEVTRRYFPGTASVLGGATLADLAERQKRHHRAAFHEDVEETLERLVSQGFYKYKKDGEAHRFTPVLIKHLHKLLEGARAVLKERSDASPFEVLPQGPLGFLEYTKEVHAERTGPRDLLDFVRHRPPIALDRVEPIETIVARFSTGAMSHGSLSAEAHRDLAVAMNRIGAASNSGEGGEDPERLGGERNSKVKQVASGRFGVTPGYLLSAGEIQIKMAQGSKPGEGGQIPGHKVSEEIARIRHTTAGIALISPPPHHDIYSIEDLSQLIFDLKRINPEAAISVKLVSSEGVGTVAAGVAKGFADVIHISGCEGGTGASPLSSIKFAGMPWELGLAEAQQILVANRLRGKVRLRVDGGFQTGRDVLISALLGADEFSFGTAALVAEGCLMARACHTNNCPVGIASQKASLRAKYPGTPEAVIAFMLGVAHHVRTLLAELGYTSLDEVIGKTELLEQVVWGEQAGHLDLSPLLWRPPDDLATRHLGERNVAATRSFLEEELIEKMGSAPLPQQSWPISNTDRAIGARLSGWLSSQQDKPAPLHLRFTGHAGQSFGAFSVEGLILDLEGAANDYVGKSLYGATLVVRPGAAESHLQGEETSRIGNTCLYGAIKGRLFVAGRAGQRFAVRNSGATAVIEGAGEHAAEYMTGGTLVILGGIGRNLGAGMTGGEIYLYDPHQQAAAKINPELVEGVALQTQHEETLQALLHEHLELTGSRRARDILADWERGKGQFLLVRPRATAAAIEAHNEGVEARSV
jgi:glutamate synthase (ferredoxin)